MNMNLAGGGSGVLGLLEQPESVPDEEAYGAINVEEGSGEGGRAGDTLTS